jgi:hypothetical protein
MAGMEVRGNSRPSERMITQVLLIVLCPDFVLFSTCCRSRKFIANKASFIKKNVK